MNNREKFLVVLLDLALVIGGQWLMMENIETNGIWEWIISSAVLLIAVPIFTIKYIFKEKLSKYFITTEMEKGGWLALLVESLVFFGLLVFIMIKFGWWMNLPVSIWLLSGSAGVVVFIDFLLMPFVVLANELFFRGLIMVFFSSWLGSGLGLTIQAGLATAYKIFFVGDFRLEKIVMFFLLNLFLGYVCFKKRTIFVSAVVSWVVYVAIDLTVFYHFVN